MSEINVTIKSSNADKTEISIDPSLTVLEFKQKIFEKLPIEPPLQRLIYKGRVLKDDCTLMFYQIEEGQTVHLVKGGGGATPQSTTPVAAPAPAAAPFGQFGMPQAPGQFGAPQGGGFPGN
jgi:ubiquilin